MRFWLFTGFAAIACFVSLAGNTEIFAQNATATNPPQNRPKFPAAPTAENNPNTPATRPKPIIPDNIPTAGAPAGSPQRNQNVTPQPGRPEQMVPPKTGQPFPPLTPEEEASLNNVLVRWEKQSTDISRFESKFRCSVFGGALLENKDPKIPDYVTYGWLRYAAPDNALYEVLGEIVDGKEVPKDSVATKLLTNGKSIYSYNYQSKVREEYKIPPEDQGNGIAGNSPLPFVFGAKAGDLKKRYYLRLLPPKPDMKDYILLEVSPRKQEDAAEFLKVIVILTEKKLELKNLIIYDVNGKSRKAYFFPNTSVIDSGLIKLFVSHFEPNIPGRDWKTTVIDAGQPEPTQSAGIRSNPAGPIGNQVQSPSVKPNLGVNQQTGGSKEIQLYAPPKSGARPEF